MYICKICHRYWFIFGLNVMFFVRHTYFAKTFVSFSPAKMSLLYQSYHQDMTCGVSYHARRQNNNVDNNHLVMMIGAAHNIFLNAS